MTLFQLYHENTNNKETESNHLEITSKLICYYLG